MKVPEPSPNPFFGFSGLFSVLGFLLFPASGMVDSVMLSRIGVWCIFVALGLVLWGLWENDKYASNPTPPASEPGGYVTV
jgi:hypothetical protein